MPIRDFDPNELLQLLDDPVHQWLDWEEQANLIGFRTSTEPVEVEVVDVPRAETEVYVLPGASPEILDRFLDGERVSFPRHPLNQDPSVAWFGAPVSERWQARFTSSRTLALHGAESGKALTSFEPQGTAGSEPAAVARSAAAAGSAAVTCALASWRL